MNDNYTSYWDEVIREWAKDGCVPTSEECWFTPDSALRRELMPEPYWGDPNYCSAVVLNYNPGGPDGEPKPDDNCHYGHVVSGDKSKMSGAMHDCYSRIALEFPWLDESDRGDFTATASLLPTKKWMRQRNGWVKRIAGSEKRPFFLDLCAWHSKNWCLKEYTPAINAYIEEHILPVIREAVAKSDMGIGLCVGKQFGDDVLPLLGFSDITSELGLNVEDKAKGWQPMQGVNRWYRVYRSADGVYIINTWAVGSNRQPGSRFSEFEKEIITKINDIKNKEENGGCRKSLKR